MKPKYAPKLDYMCPDPECCDNGCPIVTCRHCKQTWPCQDYIDAHSDSQVEAQVRYVARKWYGDDDYMIEYVVRDFNLTRSGAL